MTDTTDDIAEEISFQSFEDDFKLLGNLLNDVLQREVGSQFMAKIERIRLLALVTLFSFHYFLFSFCFFVKQTHTVTTFKMEENQNTVTVFICMACLLPFYFSFLVLFFEFSFPLCFLIYCFLLLPF